MCLSMNVARGVGGTISNVGETIRAKIVKMGLRKKSNQVCVLVRVCASVGRGLVQKREPKVALFLRPSPHIDQGFKQPCAITSRTPKKPNLPHVDMLDLRAHTRVPVSRKSQLSALGPILGVPREIRL